MASIHGEFFVSLPGVNTGFQKCLFAFFFYLLFFLTPPDPRNLTAVYSYKL